MTTPRDVQAGWYAWRTAQDWDDSDVHLAAKVAEEAGEVLGATLKMSQHGRAGTHPDHDLPKLRQEVGQLVGTIYCLAERFGIDPLAEAALELDRVHERFPVRAVRR